MKSAKSLGRPRAFDPEQALDRAMCLFWQKGYEGTSLSDLTEAMGINRPSLYAAFGNKEELFRKALARYIDGPGRMGTATQEHPTARESVEAFLRLTAESVVHSEHAGCLAVVGALACSQESDPIRQTLCDIRRGVVEAWRERFERAKREGDLGSHVDAAALAQYVMTVANGMSVQARSGATRNELAAVAEVALRAWPD